MGVAAAELTLVALVVLPLLGERREADLVFWSAPAVLSFCCCWACDSLNQRFCSPSAIYPGAGRTSRQGHCAEPLAW